MSIEAAALAAKSSITAYAALYDRRYSPNDFHRHVAKRVQAAIDAGHGRIIIEAPPQHGKSRFVSQDLPAWFMGKYPDAPVIAYAYGEDLAERNGQEVRDRMQSGVHKDVFGSESAIRSDTSSKTHFMTAAGGRYIGATVRGGATGFGSRLTIIDDPIKNRAEAESVTVRNQIKDWYTSVVLTRLEEKSIVVVMHTRWHSDDLAGWLQKEHKSEGWDVIHLPAICEDKDDALGREIGEALIPERRSLQWLTNTRKSIGEADWLSLYQQTPRDKIGRKEFDQTWFERHNGIPPAQTQDWNKYIVVDPTRTKTATSDYTAMAVIGLNFDGNRYVLEMVRDKLDIAGRYSELKRLVTQWEPSAVYYKKTAAENEIEAIRIFQDRDRYRFPIFPLAEKASDGDKNTRIRRLVPDLEKLRWLFPKNAWRKMWDGDYRDQMSDFIQQEVMQFPHGEHDDFLDCLSGAYDIGEQWPQGTNKTRAAAFQFQVFDGAIAG